ncbi:MAG: hypothetical protein Q7S14_02540 [bacterium]|nr:hypothetical protein [bacterium]
MESITQTKFIEAMRSKKISLFSVNDLTKIFGSRPQSSLMALILRMEKAGIIAKLIRGKYKFILGVESADSYEIANYLVSPSYISLETALSFYEIIDQFPYQITSVTTTKSKSFDIDGQTFAYAKIADPFFFDYEKNGKFLIASKPKAVFDYLYLAYLGKRSRNNINLLRFDKSILSKKTLDEYVFTHMGQNQKFINFYKKI